MQYFKTKAELEEYVAEELMESLCNKYEDMCALDRAHYTDEDRTNMKKRIEDVSAYYLERRSES